jgi:archaellum component FlaC
LFALQKENSVTISNIHKSLGNMNTSIQLLAQRVEDIGKTVAQVTKVSLWDGNERRKD